MNLYITTLSTLCERPGILHGCKKLIPLPFTFQCSCNVKVEHCKLSKGWQQVHGLFVASQFPLSGCIETLTTDLHMQWSLLPPFKGTH